MLLGFPSHSSGFHCLYHSFVHTPVIMAHATPVDDFLDVDVYIGTTDDEGWK